MHTLKALWEAQLRIWPESEKISIQEMYRWAEAAPEPGNQLHRWRLIALAMQHPRWIFYRTAPVEQPHWIGCRYGIQASQYLSGFSDLVIE